MSHSVSLLRTGDNEHTECVKYELSIHNCNQTIHAGERSFAVPPYDDNEMAVTVSKIGSSHNHKYS